MADFKISLAAARVNAGMTQTEAAKALGVGLTTICVWEKGERFPRFDKLEELSKVYSIPLEFIRIPTKLDKN